MAAQVLAIERPLRLPPITNAPVVPYRKKPSASQNVGRSEMWCAHREDGIIRARRRVVRRPERDRRNFPDDGRSSGAEE